eukprot:4222518-Pleurochrysis_carterae.AAC.1
MELLVSQASSSLDMFGTRVRQTNANELWALSKRSRISCIMFAATAAAWRFRVRRSPITCSPILDGRAQ